MTIRIKEMKNINGFANDRVNSWSVKGACYVGREKT